MKRTLILKPVQHFSALCAPNSDSHPSPWSLQMITICTTEIDEDEHVIPAGPWGSTRPSITAQERRVDKNGRLSNGKRLSKGAIMTGAPAQQVMI